MSYISLQKDIIMHLSGWNPVRLAIFEDEGTDKHCVVGYERAVREYLSVIYDRVSANDIREGILNGFDAIIIPGGSAGAQAKSLEDKGLIAIRDFVRGGGGYIGFCAGMYLALGYGRDKLDMIGADLIDGEHWARGKGVVPVQLNKQGKAILGDIDAVHLYYENGPIIEIDSSSWLPPLTTLGTYRGEIRDNKEAEPVMNGSPAIVASHYGTGRVICFSPHPELTCEMGDMVMNAVLWAKRQPEEKSDEK
jgi:glutamine amidotransferase-like uncharacterized protein